MQEDWHPGHHRRRAAERTGLRLRGRRLLGTDAMVGVRLCTQIVAARSGATWRFEAHLRAMAPPAIELTIHTLGASRPTVNDYQAPAIQAIAQAFERGFGAPPVYFRGGGSLPIVADLQDTLGAPIVLIDFGMPDDNTHAPNEKYRLPNFYRGIETLSTTSRS